MQNDALWTLLGKVYPLIAGNECPVVLSRPIKEVACAWRIRNESFAREHPR